MSTIRYTVQPFGRDGLGNCTGWMVVDRTKHRQTDNPCVQTFVGNIYEPEQHKAAFQAALALADRLNQAFPRTPRCHPLSS
jgi:hypothetical protein